MPYFVNCSRCNADNIYSKLGESCPKCNGSGRDWRDDNELSTFHSWAGLTIEDLRHSQVVEAERGGKPAVFTYKEKVPDSDYTKEEEVRDIRKELDLPEPNYVSQIFCQHDWILEFSGSQERCRKCEKTRLKEESHGLELKKFSYNRELHDRSEYFPNRCYACEEYSETTSDNGNPMNGEDKVYCNIGGIVKAEDGCEQFDPDSTASCDDCWNFFRNKNGAEYHCDILGKLTNMVWGKCPHHVEKEDL